MWRAEENIFVHTRPARLDTRYCHTSGGTRTPPAGMLVPPRWFHVPGSGAQDAQAPTEGLVTSTHLPCSLLQQGSSLLDHRDAADDSSHGLGLDGRDAGGGCWGMAEPSKVTPQKLPSASQSGIDTHCTPTMGIHYHNPHVRPTHDIGADETSSAEVSRLLRHYREENVRLREQLRANELHEAHIMTKLEEVSHKCARLQLAWQRASSDTPSSLFQSVDNVGGVPRAGDGSGKVQDTLQSRLAQREAEVRELQGRVEAYREALQRSRAYAALLEGGRQPASAHATCTTGSSSTASASPTSLHLLLLQSLNAADYLVKVFNALQHCHSTRHDGADGGAGGCCCRSLHDCKLRCLEAAMRGAPISRELLELEDGPENDTVAANTETAVAVREELFYCEAVAVRLAASLLGRESFADDDAAPFVRTLTSASSEKALSASPPAALRSRTALDATELAAVANEAAGAASGTDDDGEECARRGEVNTEENGHGTVLCAATVREPRRRPPRCRPDIGDCEVQ
ncbi:hypothetical protein JKF63_07933 [Porcisia hertigi]|uniref:Uncharacterized protein n=1 Tax=Porcisia hertigi TaxID=2761500 RepID=A0A836LJW4_9TRYP|nr:hypothetical protein JKF63_07933 [Porcisia hertigi]